MTFNEVLSQTMAMLQQHGRVSYRALKRQFAIDDAFLEDLKYEIIEVQQCAVDHDGTMLVRTADASAAATPLPTPYPSTSVPPFATGQEPEPLAYTPPHLAEKILTSKTALEGERKQVTVLFADLKGSMELLADRDPEEARQLLDPVLERMMAAVHRYEGTVNQVMGDGIMALFGAPIAHEDHAVRACYAALAMQAAVKQYAIEVQRTRGVPIQIRVGLNAGEVVVRAIGNDLHMDYSAIGHTTHLAARMEQMAMPGTILITPAVQGLAEGFVQVTPLGPKPIKGLDAPVEVFELVRASALRRRIQAAAARGLTRFVGRQHELEALPEDSPFRTLDPPQRRQHTLQALKRVLLRESQVQPLLVIIEDLHWIDTETQALLDTLVERLPTARLLLLVNYRPEYSHGWGSKTSYSQLRLDALHPDSAEALLRALLGDDGRLAPLKQRLIEQTEGNPFFLEESVHTLIETHGLVGEPGGYHLATSMQTLQIPATVQAVLAARIDRLPPEEKRLLQTAAVIGTEVPLPLLQAIAELPEAALHRGLAHVQAAEFLYETRLFPEPEYTFKHALTHEVAYNSLLLERRRGLHARLVEALEALTPERVAEQVERLAHHALRGEVWDKAVTCCQQAGARAFDRAAFREAVASFEQALQALAHLPEDGDSKVEAIELRLALGGALTQLGEYGRRLALLGEAEALARALDDRARLGQVLAGMAQVLRLTGDLDGAMAAGQQALDLATALGDSALQGQAAQRLGQVYYALGDFGRAAELLRRNVEAADGESGRPSTSLWIDSRAWLAFTLSALGAFAEGRRHGEEALRLATLAGRGQTPIVAHGRLGHLYLAKGDLEHAIRVLEPGLALCRASGYRGGVLRVIAAGLGYAYALQGRLAEGRVLLEEAISESLCTGALENHALWVAWLSEVYRLAGRGEEAWQHACQALDLARQQKAHGDEAHALHQLGTVQAHAAPPDVAPAEAHYQQALALAEELGMRPLVAHCHRGLGTLYAKIGRLEQARAELAAATRLYRAMAMTFWLPEAEATLAQVEG